MDPNKPRQAERRLVPVFKCEQLFANVLLHPVVMRTGLPTPDLRKLDLYGVSGDRPFDLLVLGREALAERGT